MKKKIIAIVMCIVMTVTILPVVSYADRNVYTCGEYEYTVYDSSRALATLTKYNGTDEDVIIPYEFDGYSVYVIGSEAFNKCRMNSITIPDTVNMIGDFAFAGCSVSEVIFPENLGSVGRYAFYGNSTIVHLEINTAWIYENAFDSMSNLKSVVLHNTLGIKSGAFINDAKLESVTFDTDSLQAIGNNAFADCTSLNSIHINGRRGVNLAIGEYAFSNCYNLEDVYIENLGELSLGAFMYCQRLKTFKVKNMRTLNIGESAFDWCYSLSELDFGCVYNSLQTYEYIDTSQNQRWFGRIEAHALDTGSSVMERLVIPRGVGYLGSAVYCSELWLPDTVYAIADGAISDTSVIHGFVGTYAQQYAVNNSITFEPILLGDVNEDDSVTLTDYIFVESVICEHQTELTPCQRVLSDMDGDSAIDSFDLFRIDKTING